MGGIGVATPEEVNRSAHPYRRPPRNTTLLDLVAAVSAHARSEAEVIATVVYLVNSGTVRLCGNFRGARFDLSHFERKSRAAA